MSLNSLVPTNHYAEIQKQTLQSADQMFNIFAPETELEWYNVGSFETNRDEISGDLVVHEIVFG